MPELLAALDAFMQEHRRCGDLDGGVDGERVWMVCDCGGGIAHPVKPSPLAPDGKVDRPWRVVCSCG
jgi:hypothetical protein